MTLSSLLIYVLFVNHHQGITCCFLFLFLPLRLYMEFIGREKARAYCNAYIVKSNNESKET
jgi:hypothetical protein